MKDLCVFSILIWLLVFLVHLIVNWNVLVFFLKSFDFSSASFLFIAALDCLMVSVLSFLYLSCIHYFENLFLTDNARCPSLIYTNHCCWAIYLCLCKISQQCLFLIYFSIFIKMLQQSKRKALLVLIVGNIFVAWSIPAILSNTGMFSVTIL